MTTKMINGVIKNGEIIPCQPLPKNLEKMDIKIYVFPQTDLLQKRNKYKGSVPLGLRRSGKISKKPTKRIRT